MANGSPSRHRLRPHELLTTCARTAMCYGPLVADIRLISRKLKDALSCAGRANRQDALSGSRVTGTAG
jgi:hypothetical protein